MLDDPNVEVESWRQKHPGDLADQPQVLSISRGHSKDCRDTWLSLPAMDPNSIEHAQTPRETTAIDRPKIRLDAIAQQEVPQIPSKDLSQQNDDMNHSRSEQEKYPSSRIRTTAFVGRLSLEQARSVNACSEPRQQRGILSASGHDPRRRASLELNRPDARRLPTWSVAARNAEASNDRYAPSRRSTCIRRGVRERKPTAPDSFTPTEASD